MTLTSQSKRRSLRVLGIAAGAMLLATPSSRAQGSSCATVHAASLKMEAVPYHMYFVDSAKAVAAENGGKPMVGESIVVGGAMYLLSHGKWVKSPVSLAQMNAERDKHDWTKDTCSHVRDESVNGEAASVWRTHVVTEMSTVDTEMWISKGRGVVLKANSVMDLGGQDGKNHTSARYDYSNVHPPAGVR
ncbi:MAG TPA: hypothetical protein VN607_08075 [Gemmatimonadaceae bacterium]|nr:hypothetical protein [Gemmatimonadaceae bacterium]